jgi:hypothetical protein
MQKYGLSLLLISLFVKGIANERINNWWKKTLRFSDKRVFSTFRT